MVRFRPAQILIAAALAFAAFGGGRADAHPGHVHHATPANPAIAVQTEAPALRVTLQAPAAEAALEAPGPAARGSAEPVPGLAAAAEQADGPGRAPGQPAMRTLERASAAHSGGCVDGSCCGAGMCYAGISVVAPAPAVDFPPSAGLTADPAEVAELTPYQPSSRKPPPKTFA